MDAFENIFDPLWVVAAQKATAKFHYGDLIPRAWLLKALDLAEPEVGTAMTFKAYQFDVLSRVEAFKQVMLEDHKMMLVNERGVGYRIVMPHQQAAVAMNHLQRDVAKSISKTEDALTNINTLMLTVDGERDVAEAQAKLAWFKQQIERATGDA